MISMKAPRGLTGFSHSGKPLAIVNGGVDVAPEFVEELRAHGFTMAAPEPLAQNARAALLRRFADDARGFAETLGDDELHGLASLPDDKRDRVFAAVRALARDAGAAAGNAPAASATKTAKE